MSPPRLTAIVRAVEARLADFYGFKPGSAAEDHLVSKDELKASLGDGIVSLPEYRARGGVFLSDNKLSEDLYIGIHLDEQVGAKLEHADPTVRLDDDNLDEFCVLIEEVSHFHLILNRALDAQSVSKLELEWQGEIDKMLVCAITLKEQQGDLHLEQLARRLYDGAVIIAEDYALYWEATRHAARFWRSAGRTNAPLGPEIRDLLRQTYRSPWSEKMARMDASRKAS